MTNDSEIFEKKGLDFNTAVGPQAFGDSVVSKRIRELAELSLRGSGSSSAWCSAHKVSAAAGRMFEDPGLLRLVQPAPLEFGTTIKWASSLTLTEIHISIGRDHSPRATIDPTTAGQAITPRNPHSRF